MHAIIPISYCPSVAHCDVKLLRESQRLYDEFYVKMIKLPIHPAHTLIQQGMDHFKSNLRIGWKKRPMHLTHGQQGVTNYFMLCSNQLKTLCYGYEVFPFLSKFKIQPIRQRATSVYQGRHNLS